MFEITIMRGIVWQLQIQLDGNAARRKRRAPGTAPGGSPLTKQMLFLDDIRVD